ncbi:MAG: GTP-binding protein [Vulcanimicrobiota bacterium]
MTKKALKIIIIGHVDHGKSTLIGRLLLDTNSLPRETMSDLKRVSRELGRDTELAYITDQLKEERERNITIDTTQIFFSTKKRSYVIIDAPGHVEFLKNMISGATMAEVAILVVDAREGIMEQTRRHAYIIDMLGMEKVIVLFNKMDLVQYDRKRFEEVSAELLTFFQNLSVKPSFMIPISAWEGENVSRKSGKLSWSKAPFFLDALESLTLTRLSEKKPLRLPVQDIYEIDGEEVIVGRVASGEIRQGQEIVLLPNLAGATVKSVRIFGDSSKKSALEGENIGLTVDRTGLVKRGHVIVERENQPEPTISLKGNLFWMSEEPLKLTAPVTLRLATQEVLCCAVKIENRINSSTLEVLEREAGELQLNEAGAVTFETDTPVVAERFSFIEELGRFVIEKQFQVQGAGIITGSL